MDARRLSHLKKAGVSAALEIQIARQDILAQICRSIFLCQLSAWLNELAILAQLTLWMCKCCVLRVARGPLMTRTLARL